MSRRRAYAMPMVVVLALGVSLVVTVTLQRQGATALSVQRQIDRAVEHHRARGVQEMAAAWLQSAGADGIEPLLNDDGLAFEMNLPERRTIRAYIREAQDSLVRTPTDLTGERLEIYQRAVESLEQDAIRAPALRGTLRNAGPASLYPLRARREVLYALALAVTEDEDRADSYADSMIRERSGEDEINSVMLNAAASRAGFDATQRRNINALLALEPELFAIRVDVLEPPGPGRFPAVVARFQGLTRLSGGVGGPGDTTGNTPFGMFIEWEAVPVDNSMGNQNDGWGGGRGGR